MIDKIWEWSVAISAASLAFLALTVATAVGVVVWTEVLR